MAHLIFEIIRGLPKGIITPNFPLNCYLILIRENIKCISDNS